MQNILLTPNFLIDSNLKVWFIALTIAIVASIQTSQSIEVADRMDVQKGYTNTNVALKAQVIGKMLRSLLRCFSWSLVFEGTSANSNAGAKYKMLFNIQCILLLISVVAIPLATRAAIILPVRKKYANHWNLCIF